MKPAFLKWVMFKYMDLTPQYPLKVGSGNSTKIKLGFGSLSKLSIIDTVFFSPFLDELADVFVVHNLFGYFL